MIRIRDLRKAGRGRWSEIAPSGYRTRKTMDIMQAWALRLRLKIWMGSKEVRASSWGLCSWCEARASEAAG